MRLVSDHPLALYREQLSRVSVGSRKELATYEANRQVLRGNLLFVVTGEVQPKDGAVNVLLNQVEVIGD